MFENFLVVDESGKILFERCVDEDFDPNTFGQMLIAFNQLITQLANDKLSDLEWGDKRIFIKKKGGLLFVACSDPDIKFKTATENLDYLTKRFFMIYSKILLDEFKETHDRGIFSHGEKRFYETLNEFIEWKLQILHDHEIWIEMIKHKWF